MKTVHEIPGEESQRVSKTVKTVHEIPKFCVLCSGCSESVFSNFIMRRKHYFLISE